MSLLLSAIAPGYVAAATLTVGNDRALRTIAEAARVAKDGDVIEITR